MASNRTKRILSFSVLPGQPRNASGRLCIHLFVSHAGGHITEPCVTQLDEVALQHGESKLTVAPMTGSLACDPRKKVDLVTKNGVTHVTLRTGDPRAATCPKCLASDACKKMLELLNGTTELTGDK